MFNILVNTVGVGIFILGILLLTSIGFILGIVSLKKGKNQIGKRGIILSIVAIIVAVLPALWFGFLMYITIFAGA